MASLDSLDFYPTAAVVQAQAFTQWDLRRPDQQASNIAGVFMATTSIPNMRGVEVYDGGQDGPQPQIDPTILLSTGNSPRQNSANAPTFPRPSDILAYEKALVASVANLGIGLP